MTMKPRTNIVDALHAVLEVLRSGEAFTLNELARKSDLNFRTVKKIIDILQSSHDSFFGKQFGVSSLKSTTIIQLREKAGLLMFPEAIQNLIIKTSHYPAASRDEEILVHLFLQKATKPENAAYLPENKTVGDLADAEFVGRIGNRFYLTEDGAYIAKGALELYPELEDMSTEVQKDDDAGPVMIPWITVAVPPSPIMIKSKLDAVRRTQ